MIRHALSHVVELPRLHGVPRERAEKVRERQAVLPGYCGLTPPLRLPASPRVDKVSGLARMEREASSSPPRHPGPSPRLAGSLPKLNTIQLGLAAVFNPDNYIQKKDKLPFLPGAFADQVGQDLVTW